MDNCESWQTERPDITLVVPCYNEENALPVFYQEVSRIMTELSVEYELILVNDGSTDKTLSLIKQFATRDSHIEYLSFSRNFGKEAAMYAGFCNSHGEYVAIMDADMQDPPALLPEMLALLQNGEYDSVGTRRVDRHGEPPLRSWLSRCFYKLMNIISDAEIVDGARDFRLMKREMVDAIVAMSESNRFSKGIFGWIGFHTYWMSYENVERIAGKTKWSFWKLFKYAVEGIVNFSQTPLRIASGFGILITACSFIVLLGIIIRRLVFGDPVAGWASTICIMLFLGGVQMFCNGIMGQYIAKTYVETKQRPHYIIAETNCRDVIKIK
jgi:glycosyltransferase involved in cell wall biosynthesis